MATMVTVIIGGDEDDNGGGGGGGDRRQRRRGHRQQSTKSREEKMATATATAAVTATVTMTVTTMTKTMRTTARGSAGHRRHKGTIVMLSSNRVIKFKFEFLRRILRIFCSRHFVKTPPDHGVRRSVAPMAHFYKVSCPDTLGASSLGAQEQFICFLCLI